MPTRTSFMIGWLAMLAASSAVFVLVAVAAWWQHRREVPSKARLRAEREEWARHAARVVEGARRAAARAAAAQEQVAVAEQERAAAWRELEEIEAAHDRAAGRYEELVRRGTGQTGNGGPDQPGEPEGQVPPEQTTQPGQAGQPGQTGQPGQAARLGRLGQHEVTHAAMAAYRRGDLTREQLWRVWQWGSGWDPELDRCERELYRLRAARREAHLRYRAAASREREVLAAADVADVQARALAEEAATAAQEAGWHDDRRVQPQ